MTRQELTWDEYGNPVIVEIDENDNVLNRMNYWINSNSGDYITKEKDQYKLNLGL
jgi:hypothetical protein